MIIMIVGGVPTKLTGRLRVVSLQDSPFFTALSYVWGPSLPSRSPVSYQHQHHYYLYLYLWFLGLTSGGLSHLLSCSWRPWAQGGDLSRLGKLLKWRKKRALLQMNVDREEAWASSLSDILARWFVVKEFRELREILDHYKKKKKDLIPPSSSNPQPGLSSERNGGGGTSAENHDNEEGWTDRIAARCQGVPRPVTADSSRWRQGGFLSSVLKEASNCLPVPASGNNDVDEGNTGSILVPLLGKGEGLDQAKFEDVVLIRGNCQDFATSSRERTG